MYKSEAEMSEIRKDYFMVDKDSWVYEAFIKEDAPIWFGVDLASKDDQHIEAEMTPEQPLKDNANDQ